jgi:chemotaxis protein MotB
MRSPRRPPSPQRTSRDRWLVAYADMLTLLFAVFASLYASRIDFLPPTAQAAEGSATGASVLPSAGAASGDDALWNRIQLVVARTGSLRSLELRREPRGLVISLPEAGSFPAGRAELSPAAERVMRDLADVLRASAGPVRVEGHTDDRPIHNGTFASNWELSTARATEVVQFLVKQGGLPASRLSAAGFGEFRPLTPNTSDAARAKNRRVDLIVLNGASAVGGR